MDAATVSTGAEALDEMIEGGFPQGSLVIVAGNPGSGKTAFAINFACKGISSGDAVVFASLGEPREAFINEISRHFHFDAEQFMRTDKMSFLDLSIVREGGAPSMIQSILDRVERTGAKRLVIDSFSAMALAFERKLDTRSILQAILSKVVRQLGCTTILAVEIPFGDERVGTGVEEFVADGVIKLGSEMIDDRLIRVLELVKLRGTRLAERKLIFTLEEGFKVFAPFQLKPIASPKPFKAIPDKPGRFSSGSEDLDRLLNGGYPVGSTILFEIGRGVPVFHNALLQGQVVRNFMANGRAGIMLPSTGIDPKMMKMAATRIGFKEKDIDRLLRLCLLRFSESSREPYVIPLEGENIDSDNKLIRNVEEELRKETGKPIVYVMGYDSVIANYGLKAAMKTAVLDAARAMEHGNLGIISLRLGYGKASVVLNELAYVHFRLAEKYGALILYGIKPRTNLFVVEVDVSRGYDSPKLTPIL
ncbi:MAG: ATPase domain-containing protein [Promethearchaeati archaeon SRVP18_Atabeyarchaeia-1]